MKKTPDHIQRWEDRLDYNKPQSPSNAEKMAAMKAEIAQLRSLYNTFVKRHEHKMETVRKKVEYWRKLAYAYRLDSVKARKNSER